MMQLWIALAGLPVGIWIYLLTFRGHFWLERPRPFEAAARVSAVMAGTGATGSPEEQSWPSVVAVIPARNEADIVGQTVTALLRQDYPGSFRIVLVDDDSDDGTEGAARAAAVACDAVDRIGRASSGP